MTPCTVDHEAPQSVGFPRQEYCNSLPFSSPGDLPNPGIKSTSLRWQVDSLLQSHQGSPIFYCSVQFSSVTQSCPTLCDPMNCSTPGLPVHHRILAFTQTHVHRVGDAIQPSHPLSSPSPPAPNPSPASGSFPMSQLFT